MLQLVIGSFALSVVHALIPNHWVPMVLIGKAEKWSSKEILGVTALTGFAHVLSTISLGVLIGIIGFNISNLHQNISDIIAPLILIFMGLVYFGMDFSQSKHSHLPEKRNLQGKSKAVIVLSLTIAMFFSPCLEIETYYFTAGTLGWSGILVVSVIYLIVSIAGMLLMVSLGMKGLEKFQWHFLEHHERKITGALLITLGIITYFVGH
ncbi:MAG: hypothetical protein RH860_11835 [Cytophagales bacterium]